MAGLRLEALALVIAFLPWLATGSLFGSGASKHACQLSISAPLHGEVFQAAACPVGISGEKGTNRVVWVVLSGSAACIPGITATVKIDGVALPPAQLARTEDGDRSQLRASIPVNVSLGEHSIFLKSKGDAGVEDSRASATFTLAEYRDNFATRVVQGIGIGLPIRDPLSRDLLVVVTTHRSIKRGTLVRGRDQVDLPSSFPSSDLYQGVALIEKNFSTHHQPSS